MPKIVVIAGPNGAGKSTTAPLLLREALEVDEFVNADTLASGLSAFAPEQVAIAAGRLMLRRLDDLASQGCDFAFETTLASRSFAPWLKQLEARGYDVNVIYLWLHNATLAVDRVAERVRRGGHGIPPAVVTRRYERGLVHFFELYRPLADFWLMLDNSDRARLDPIAWQQRKNRLVVSDDSIWSELVSRYDPTAANRKQ